MKKQMLLLGIALIILLTGCTGKSGSAKRKKIEYMYSGGIANTKIMEVVKQAFEAENPEYELYLNFVPNWSAFRTKVKMTVAAGMPPDIIVDTPGVISDFYERNVLYDLTDFINQDPIFQSIKKDISPPELLDVGKIKGRYWSLPAWQNPTVIFYNKRLFKESGVPFPDDDWTFEEFTEAIKKLTKRDQDQKVTQYGLVNTLGQGGLKALNAATSINKEGTEAVLNSRKSYEILKWHHELIFKYKCIPRMIGGQTETMMKPYQLFQMERTAMLLGGHYHKNVFNESTDLDYDVALVPRMDKDGKIYNNSVFWMVLKDGKNIPGALKLLNYLAGPVFQEEVCRAENDVPILKSIQTSPLFLKPEVRPEHDQVFLDSLKKSFFNERYSVYNMTGGITLNNEKAFIEGIDLTIEMLDEDNKIIQKALDEFKKDGKLDYPNF